jgi:hypothetical protein
MTSGLHWDEESYPYTDIRNSETAMDAAPGPVSLHPFATN